LRVQETLDPADVPLDDLDESDASPATDEPHDRHDRHGWSSAVITGGPGFDRRVLAAVAATGLALRLIILFTPIGRPDADEVVAGLMARHLTADGFSTFYWGQHYGGTIEIFPVWLSMHVLGDTLFSMRFPTFVLAGVNALMVWRLARRVLPERQAQLAGMLLWLGPPASVWLGLREQLFYPPTVTMGLVLGVFAFRIKERGRWRDYAVLGLVAGVGWWTTPSILYFVVPAAVVFIDRPQIWRRWRELAVGIPLTAVAAVAGAWPWIYDCLKYDSAPLHATDTFPVHLDYWSRYTYFFNEGLPGALGFRETFTYNWILGPLAVVAYLGVAALIVVGLAKAVRARSWEAVGFLFFPFMFAKITWVTDNPNMRYLFYVVPFVAVLLARALSSRRAASIALVATLCITLIGMQRLHAVSELDGSRYRIGNVGDLDPVIEELDRLGIDAVYGDYWVAYRLDFETKERIVATPSWGIPRYDPYIRTVDASPRSAYVISGHTQEVAFTEEAQKKGFTFERHPAGEFLIVIPSRPVKPGELSEAARHPAGSGS
jgi:hypothetical protein